MCGTHVEAEEVERWSCAPVEDFLQGRETTELEVAGVGEAALLF